MVEAVIQCLIVMERRITTDANRKLGLAKDPPPNHEEDFDRICSRVMSVLKVQKEYSEEVLLSEVAQVGRSQGAGRISTQLSRPG